MTAFEAQYPIAPKGLATSFAESEVPLEYCLSLRNRFRNTSGSAERRNGIVQLGDTITGSPTIDALHEMVAEDGAATLFASGGGKIYRFSGVSAWSEVYSSGDSTATYRSVQINDRMVFVNGSNRNIFTLDGTTFAELQAIIERGTATAGTSAKGLDDSSVTDWVAGTDVVTNDLVYYVNRNAYGIVTAVLTSAISHTNVSAAATGIGATSSGEATTGDVYRIIDTVEMNIIPTNDPIQFDNVATLTSGSSTTVIAVSGVNFASTEARVGDFVYNTTRAAVTRITSVSANCIVTTIAGQTAGDSVVFLKSAMPIATYPHVHFGRLYLIDARDQTKIRISGANSPEDFTTDAATLDSITYNFGAQQPQGDILLAMGSYQQYFVAAGKRYLYAFSGTTPVPSSAAATDDDFSPVGLFPQGVVSPDGVLSIGNDLVFISHDGVQAISQTADASTLGRQNLSEPLRKSLREEIEAAPTASIKLFHYPHRSWLCAKIDDLIYIYNYSELVGQTQYRPNAPNVGSWSVFDGKFARQKAFLVRADGTLVCAGADGKVYQFDQGTYGDDGESVRTEYITGWLTLEEPKRTTRRKQTTYIKPLIEAGADIEYTYRLEGSYEGESTDTVTFRASGGATPIGLAVVGEALVGGSPVQNIKFPLRVRGEVVRLTVTTSGMSGPDLISRYTIYGVKRGRV